ncbi:MAG: DUF1583 domain-containing protein [Planctomycetales bacterium]|nr:DUF1583 domain-containing protein [Planctomycetales bacterium]
MNRASQLVLALLVLLPLELPEPGGTALQAQDPQPFDPAALTEDEQRQVQIVERFLQILKRAPKRGTALDRVYGHHVEFGTLDSFIASLQRETKEQPDDGAAWMLLGLFEAQRGAEADAAEALTKAETLRPDDALASFYLAGALQQLGKPDEAVAALQRATQRKPARADQLEIYRQLGRMHQRAQRTDDALAVWNELESLFPGDPRVQEQIAVTMVEEGQFEQALPRFEKLADAVRDEYRQTMFRIEAAELKVRLKRRDEGIADLEKLIDNLNPEGWLFRDVRRRIEDVFLSSGDQDGLVTYYEKWLGGHPEDVGAMVRLARFLASSARIPEATKWMEQALKLAPSRTDLRRSFIDQLMDEQKYVEAGQQFELLVESAPENMDYLRDWGRMVLRDRSTPKAESEARAAKIWNRIVAARPDDPVTLAQVGDLFRQAKLNDQALPLYQRAVELAPNDPQYREYLGEFYHVLKRPDDAKETWQQIAAGDRRNAVNLARLAEVYYNFGYLEDAVQKVTEACQLDGKDFALHIRAAKYHSRAEKHDEALRLVDAAEQLAEREEELDTALTQRIEVLQSAQRLEQQTQQLAASLKSDDKATAKQWHTLARYYQAARLWTDASLAIDTALKLEPKSLLALTTAARISESAGDYGKAAEMNRQLAAVDRRARGDHLMNVARLETQLGRTDEALSAARELIVSAPGNTENYQFYAQLCFRLGKSDEGLDALRKAVRIDPTDVSLTLALGEALNQQFKTEEAIEVYWRAFDKMEELEDQVNVTTKLTELYLQTGQFEQLLQRFERDRSEERKRRAMTICLAQAHHTAGDFGTARAELESLLSEDTRDTNLLQQLSKLCESSSDVPAAVDYQRQLAEIAPGPETEFRLATLLQRNGDEEQAAELIIKLTAREEDPVKLIRSIDSLLRQGAVESVLGITEPMLANNRDDWELLYREGSALAETQRWDEAETRFNRILNLNLPYDQLGRAAEQKRKDDLSKAKLASRAAAAMAQSTPLSALSYVPQVRAITGLELENYYGSVRWYPDTFGAARLAAIAWGLRIHQEREATGEVSPLATRLAEAAEPDGAATTALYDVLYLRRLENDYGASFDILRRLAATGDPEAQRAFLQGASSRHVGNAAAGDSNPRKSPLGEQDLELLIRCHESQQKSDDNSLAATGQVIYASNGQAYIQVAGNWVPIGSFSGHSLQIVLDELRLAGQDERANRMLKEHIGTAKTASEIARAISLLIQQKQTDEVPAMWERWPDAAKTALAKLEGKKRENPLVLGQMSENFLVWTGELGADEENQKVLKTIDLMLNIAVEQGKLRVANRSQRSSTSSLGSSRGYQLATSYGSQRSATQIAYPTPNQYIDQSALQVLYQGFDVLKRNDVTDDLVTLLRQRAEQADEASKPYEQMMLAYVLWWSDDREAAVDELTRAAGLLRNDPEVQFEMAEVNTALGNFDEALEIVDQIAPRDQKLIQQKELTALQLAERLGDVERARTAAQRLFGLRLSSDVQLSLVGRMQRLGLHELAESVTARAHRRAGNQTSSLSTLMTLYQSQGKTDVAQQIAHQILRRTAPTSASSSGRNPLRYRNSNDGQRQAALAVLQQTGGLQPLIDRAEQQLKLASGSEQLYQQLIEYYQISNNSEKATELLAQACEALPDSAVLQLQLAKAYEKQQEFSKACDCFLVVLKSDPRWIMEDFYQIGQTFQKGKRNLDLLKSIDETDIRKFGQVYYLIDLTTQMMRSSRSDQEAEDASAQQALAIKLFERIYESNPSYRSQLLSQLYDEELWKVQQVFELGMRGTIPSRPDAERDPWFGLGNVRSTDHTGRVSGTAHQMINGVKGTPQMATLRQRLEQASKEMPQWSAGKLLLLSIAREERRQEDAQGLATEVAALAKDKEGLTGTTLWMIAQELAEFEEHRGLALELLQRALRDNSNHSQLQFSPTQKLTHLLAAEGRSDEARDVLLKALRSQSFPYHDPDYVAYQKLENSTWVGDRLQELGYPGDAVRLYQQVAADSKTSSVAGRYYGDPERYSRTIRDKLTRALESLEGVDAKSALDAFLLVDAEAEDADALEFNLATADPRDGTVNLRADGKPAIGELSSSLMDNLRSLANGVVSKELLIERLDKLQVDRPTDLSIAVVRAALGQELTPKDSEAAVETLLKLASSSELEPIAEGRRPNTRQRKEAARLIPLWLVARHCLKNGQLDAGDRLGHLAILGAERQVDNKVLLTILTEWGQIALDTGNRELAEQKWTELLEAATKRPQARKRPSAKQTGSLLPRMRQLSRGSMGWRPTLSLAITGWVEEPTGAADSPSRVPPLTNSQFATAIHVALLAANHDMPALSQRAVKESLAGGMPVADPEIVQQPGSPYGAASMAIVGPASSSPETFAQPLLPVMQVWREKAGYDPNDVYELLAPLVFPESRPTEIMLYPQSVSAHPASLAQELVYWSERAKRLDDLEKRIASRSDSPSAQAPGHVLGIQIALSRGGAEELEKQVVALAEWLQSQNHPRPQMVTALHGVLPAVDFVGASETTLERGYALMQKYVEHPEGGSPLGELGGKVMRRLARQGDSDAVKRMLDAYLTVQQAQYAHYSGDYGQYRQWQDLASVATVAARFGATEAAATYLGQVHDIKLKDRSRPDVRQALTRLIADKRRLDPQQRYEFWRDWTLPTDTRKTLRVVTAFTPLTQHPQVPEELRTEDFVSNVTELIAAAAAVGKLDEVRQRLEQAQKDKLPHVKYLLPLVHLASGDLKSAEPLVRSFATSINNRYASNSKNPGMIQLDYLLYRTCMQSPECVRWYPNTARGRLVRAARQRGADRMVLRRLPIDFLHGQSLVSKTTSPALNSDFHHWVRATTGVEPTNATPSWWVAHEGHIGHLTGQISDLLLLKYPLTGDFEFSVDCYGGAWAQGDMGFNGLLVEAHRTSSSTFLLRSSGGHESFRRPAAMRRGGDAFGRVTVRVAGDKVKWLLNNEPMYEEPLRKTSPWLTLFAEGADVTSFRKPTFVGTPRIPREVPLIDGNSMEGWNTSFLGDTQRPSRELAEPDTSTRRPGDPYRRPTHYDWEVSDSVLTARPKANAESQPWLESWAYYHRPLLPGETFAYEFRYEAGKAVAFPTIGRTALLLGPAGVAEHWIADRNGAEINYGVDVQSRLAADATYDRSPISLKENDWNEVRLTRNAEGVQLQVNGQAVKRLPLAPEADARVGLFRLASQHLEVRRATLSGDWPAELSADVQKDLFGAEPYAKSQDGVHANSMLAELLFAHDLYDVMAEARELSDEQAYERLAEWVLPNRWHRALRLYYDFARDEDPDDIEWLVCPAVELAAVAKRLGRLDQLRQQVEAIEPTSALTAQPVDTMRLLIALEQGDDDSARQLLKSIFARVAELPSNLGSRNHACEYVAAHQAARRPLLRSAARDLALELRAAQRESSTNARYYLAINALAGRLNAQVDDGANEIDGSQALNGLSQWTPVPIHTAETRYRGYRPTTWRYQRGALQHVPGETFSQLYFQSPLRGKFEIHERLTTHGFQETLIGYGTHAAMPRHDLKAIRVHQLPRGSSDTPKQLEIPNWSTHFADVRIVVEGDRVTTFVDGQLLHTHQFTQPPDPWVLIQPEDPNRESQLQNVRIVGQPEIPDSINLIELDNWRADVFEEGFQPQPANSANYQPPWHRQGNQLIGAKSENRSAESRESLLLYPRPMLEDGVIEFEAFYEPGRTEVHPSLGRTAYVIGTEGVNTHRLTNAEWNDELLSSNLAPLADAKLPELKERQWNKYRLELKGHQLTLFVNDAEIATVEVAEDPAERHFGLFHFANRTQVKVRNLIYTGQWPKTLPSPEEQQLAFPATGLFTSLPDAADAKSTPYRLSAEGVKQAGGRIVGPPAGVALADGKARLVLSESDGNYQKWPGLLYDKPVAGNFDLHADLADIKFTPHQEQWGVGSMLQIDLDDAEKSVVELGAFISKTGRTYVKAMHRHLKPDGKSRYHDQIVYFDNLAAVRLRLVRIGNEVFCTARPNGGDEVLIRTFQIAGGAVQRVSMQNKCSDNHGKVDVTVTELALKKTANAGESESAR